MSNEKYKVFNKKDFITENILENNQNAKEVFDLVLECVKMALNITNSLQNTQNPIITKTNKISVALSSWINDNYNISKKENK